MERKSSAYLNSDDMFSTYAQKTYMENIPCELDLSVHKPRREKKTFFEVSDQVRLKLACVISRVTRKPSVGFRPAPTQTGLYSLRNRYMLEISDLESREKLLSM